MAAQQTSTSTHQTEDRLITFERAIYLDYEDGPLEGVLLAVQGNQSFAFSLLGRENHQDIRIFAISPLPLGSFERASTICAATGEPRSPVWVPVWRFTNSDQQQRAESDLELLLGEAEPPAFVVAARDLVLDVVRVHPIASGELENVTNWFDRLGLARNSER